MIKLLLIAILLISGCSDNRIIRTADECQQNGYKGVVSSVKYSYGVLQSCSNGERVGKCYMTQDGNMCDNINSKYPTTARYSEFK